MIYANDKSWQGKIDELNRQSDDERRKMLDLVDAWKRNYYDLLEESKRDCFQREIRKILDRPIFSDSKCKQQEDLDKVKERTSEISNSRNSDSMIAAPTLVAEDANSDSVKPSPASVVGVAIQHLHHTTVSPSGDSICQSSPESTYNSSSSSPRLQPISASVAESSITGNINISNSDNLNLIDVFNFLLAVSAQALSRRLIKHCGFRCPRHHRPTPNPGVTSPPRLARVRPRPPSTALT